MSQKNLIKKMQISERRGINNSTNESKVTLNMCNRAKSILNETKITELANNISSNTSDCNNYWKFIMEMVEELELKDSKSYPKIRKIIEYGILPKLSKESIQEAIRTIQDKEIPGQHKMLNILEDTLITERISSNHNALSKRFNIDRMAKNIANSKYISEGITDMCNLIDTYDISKEAKFNIAIENIPYALQMAGCEESVIENITDYFLMNESVITDQSYSKMQSLLKNSRTISNQDKELVSYFTESKSESYQSKIVKLASKCKNKESANLIASSIKINNEKQASAYIKKATTLIDNNMEDSNSIITSIFSIPLRGKISKAFISYQYKLASDKNNVSNKISDKKFIGIVGDILDDDEDMLVESVLLTESVEDNNLSQIMEYSQILESEDYGESQDIDKILKSFKAEQEKSMGKFKYYLGKIYRKSPESIIDETPNILSIIRITFIAGTAIVVPVIGPIISLVMIFVDKLISMKINDKQSAALIKSLEREMDKVDKDIEKKPDRKSELEKYNKCLESCVKKVDAYREAQISYEELENRRKKSGKSSDKDEFDFGLNDDFDFELENTLTMINATNIILEAKTFNLEAQLCKNMASIVDADADSILNLTYCCPDSINFNNILNTIRDCKRSLPLKESVVLETKLITFPDIRFQSDVNNITDLIIEAYCIEQLQGILQCVNEGFNLNKLKLALQAAKGKAKELSTKEKTLWQNVDIASSGFVKSMEKAMTSNRREAIIKGSIIPSFSKCIKTGIAVGVTGLINPILGIITALGMLGVSKKLNKKERQLIYDEIDTELKVIDKQIELANNDGDIKQYRFLLQYQKKLEREKQRIKYGLKVHGRDIPDSRPKED